MPNSFYVNGKTMVTTTDDNYTALVPLTAYDSDSTVIGSTVVTITGPKTDVLADIKTKLGTSQEVADFKSSVTAGNTMRRKFDKLDGYNL